MDSLTQWRLIKLAEKRWRKKVKRKGKRKRYTAPFKTDARTQAAPLEFQAILEKTKCPHFEFFVQQQFIPAQWKEGFLDTEMPERFSLTEHYEQTIATISTFVSRLYSFRGEVVLLDFINCRKVDLAALFLLKIVLEEYSRYLSKIRSQNYGAHTYFNIVKVNKSKSESVNNQLRAMRLIHDTVKTHDDMRLVPVACMDLIRGTASQRLHQENVKGQTSTNIVKFINNGIKRHGFELSADGINHFEGIITEVLNNAEDHSSFDHWYACASLSETPGRNNEDFVGEIQLHIFNFGYSISEGFELTREKNQDTYDDMMAMYEAVNNKKPTLFSSSFTKDNLFTLYSLSQGISRLKYEDASRGTGTIRFLTSFIDLGDYEDKKAEFEPKLHIISGHSMLICDKTHKPYPHRDVYYLSLNPENDMRRQPSKENLIALEKGLPGTLLAVKIYLNKKDLNAKINKNGTQEA